MARIVARRTRIRAALKSVAYGVSGILPEKALS